ncbi:MAG TPA: peptidoglycan DD-metalloendopeptidase family protein [Thermoanaerobaculia bacterium]|jgi:murein DD-endopeptidase MepM/ murein hydrolase activator NlpD|nr:peptidoglycan DD-metalloendopeptidase family protein [Thermoanaerobaculia bacterium]
MQSKRVYLGPKILRWLLPLGLSLLAAGLFFTTKNLEAYNRSPFPIPPTPRFNARAALPNETSPFLDRARVPVEFKLLRGETVADVFGKLGLEDGEIREATDALASKVDLRSLRAGNQYSAFFNPDSSLASFEMTLAGSGRVQMVRAGGQWQSDWQPFERRVEIRSLRGTLQGSLEESIREAGGPATLAYRLADVFQWDLDFAKDLRRGDRFEVLYQEVQLDGQFHEVGTLLAVVYDNQGRLHEAYRYGDAGVYYDGEGRPMRKMFLRSPLRYSRITSMFSRRRFHPVLKEYRPHYGVDYGAPVGTPVQVTANGVVTFAGWDRGGGNVVKVQHPGGYLTCYLHLSRFASGIRPGARVRQGDIVAYTGATGLASGPHLDYRVKLRNDWIDPLALTSVRDEPIPTSRLAAFRSWRNELRTGLETGVLSKDLHVPDLPETQLATREVDATLRTSRGAVAR